MAQFTEVGTIATVENLNKFLGGMGRMDDAIKSTSEAANQGAGRVGNLGGKLAGIGKTAAAAAATGVAAAGAAIAGIGIASLKTAVDFESAWAGVVKTTDGLVDEFGNLTDSGAEIQQAFRDLAKDVPIAVEELMEIGELGGQLGVAKGDLIDFSETIAAMGVSTNLTTEAAATGFAQLANVMGTTERLGGEAFERLGSSIVALGNNSATTEADILNFAQRIAGAAAVAGVTEADMLGIGAAFSSVGVAAEAGGTAVQKVLLGMNTAVVSGGDQLEIFAATAGMSADDFGAAWEKDAGAAFTDFVNGLGMAGDDAIFILEELGLKDQRLIKAFLSLAGAGDVLNDSLDIANKGWDENLALSKEADQRYATTESQMVLLKNSLKDVAITIGSALLPFFNKLIQAARPLIDELGKQLPAFLDNVLMPALQDLMQFLSTFLPQAFEITRSIVADVLLPALQTVWGFISENVVPILQTMWTWLATFLPQAFETTRSIVADVLLPALQTVWGFISENVVPILQTMWTWLATFLPQALQALSVFWSNVLLPAIEEIWSFVQDSLIPAFEAFVTFLVSVLKPAAEEVISFAQEVFQTLVDWVQENWPLIQQTINTVMTFIQGVITNVLNAVSAFWEANGQSIMNAARQIWEAIKTIVTTAINLVLDIIKAVMQIINGDWSAAWETIKTALTAAWEAMKPLVRKAISAIRTTIKNIMTMIKNLWNTAWAAIKTKVDDVVEGLKSVVSSGMNLVKAIIQTAMTTIKSTVNLAWTFIKTKFSQGITAVKTTLTNAKQALKSAGEAIVNAVKEGISNAWSGLVSWFQGKLGDLADMLPFSEPRDPRSKLRGLDKAGQAIVHNIQSGIAEAMPALQAQLNAAVTPMQSMPPVTAGGGAVTTTNITNVEVNPMLASQPDEMTMFNDVTAALIAART